MKEQGAESQFPPGKLEVLLRRADEDQDGILEYEEFMRLVCLNNSILSTCSHIECH